MICHELDTYGILALLSFFVHSSLTRFLFVISISHCSARSRLLCLGWRHFPRRNMKTWLMWTWSPPTTRRVRISKEEAVPVRNFQLKTIVRVVQLFREEQKGTLRCFLRIMHRYFLNYKYTIVSGNVLPFVGFGIIVFITRYTETHRAWSSTCLVVH